MPSLRRLLLLPFVSFVFLQEGFALDLPPCRTVSDLSVCSWIDYMAWVPSAALPTAAPATTEARSAGGRLSDLRCDSHTGICTGGGDERGVALADPALLALSIGDDSDAVFKAVLEAAPVDKKENVSACQLRYVAWACAQRLPRCSENLDQPLAVCQDTCEALFEWCIDNDILSDSDRKDLPHFGSLDRIVCSALPTTDCTATGYRHRASAALLLLLVSLASRCG